MKVFVSASVRNLLGSELFYAHLDAMACVNVPNQAMAPISRLMARVWGNSDANAYKDAKALSFIHHFLISDIKYIIAYSTTAWFVFMIVE